MFGFGGWLNRLGWNEIEDGGWFDEYPDSYYCRHCGAEL